MFINPFLAFRWVLGRKIPLLIFFSYLPSPQNNSYAKVA